MKRNALRRLSSKNLRRRCSERSANVMHWPCVYRAHNLRGGSSAAAQQTTQGVEVQA
jgi:hypothetical protein